MVIAEKTVFMGKVFLNLIFQAVVAYTAASKIDETHVRTYSLVYVVGIFITSVAMMFTESIPLKFMLFTILSTLMGALLTKKDYAVEVVREVAMIFTGMFLLGLVSVQLNINLRPYAPILLFALLALLFKRLYDYMTGTERTKAVSKIATVIFALLVVYDTNDMLQKDYGGDFVTGSLDYFLNIISLLNSVEEI